MLVLIFIKCDLRVNRCEKALLSMVFGFDKALNFSLLSGFKKPIGLPILTRDFR